MKISGLRVSLMTMGLAAALHAMPASASTVSGALDLLNTYNAIVFGDMTSSSHTDGAVLVGGDLSASNVVFNMHSDANTAAAAAGTPAMTVIGNVTGSVQADGSAVVGGNLSSGASISVNGRGGVTLGGNVEEHASLSGNGNVYVGGDVKNASVTATGGDLSIGGKVTGNSTLTGNFNGTGNLYVGGTVSGSTSITANGGSKNLNVGTVPAGSTASQTLSGATTLISSAETTLQAYSRQLASLTANNDVSWNGSVLTFNATTADGNGVAVFDIAGTTLSYLSSASSFIFSLAQSVKEIIVNVTGVGANTLNINADVSTNGGDTVSAQVLGTNTIWNFSDATGEVNISSLFGGDILAAYADLTNTGNIEGTVVADSLTQLAEIHYDGQHVSTVPLPAALSLFAAALLLTGVGGLTARTRRREMRPSLSSSRFFKSVPSARS